MSLGNHQRSYSTLDPSDDHASECIGSPTFRQETTPIHSPPLLPRPHLAGYQKPEKVTRVMESEMRT